MKKITLTIGISAYNEEQNIKRVLNSVLNQREDTFRIREILVYSDGSTDNTVQIAKSIGDKRLKVFDDGVRVGKPTRLNMIFRKFKSDILVIIDSDMYLKNNMSLEYLLNNFKNDKNIHLAAGNTEPVKPRTFIEKAVANFKICREEMESFYSFGNTAYGAHAYLAYSSKFARSLVLPGNILNDDAYSYFMCIKKGYKFAFARNSKAMYRAPQNLEDFCKQSIRHRAGGVQLFEYFGKDTVLDAFYVPGKILLLLMIKQLIRNPLGYIFLRSFNLYFYLKTNYSKHIKKQFDAKWDVIHSSKILVRK